MKYNWENKNIVVVEDVDFNFILIKRQLKKTKANIVWLKNGQEVVDYIKEKRPVDAILMDVRMPIMNGIDATKVIKHLDSSIPIIMQTACVVGTDYDEVISSGCDDYIFKPIVADELIEKINKQINPKEQ
jgi:CheY-like chemotaxis protein